jgi:NAD(P)-dependent dehydrogenase (short-subunit alcohol dehydrogenase family)
MTRPGTWLDFAGRWVVVTGASSGLGRAVAAELAACGARVMLIGATGSGCGDRGTAR